MPNRTYSLAQLKLQLWIHCRSLLVVNRPLAGHSKMVCWVGFKLVVWFGHQTTRLLALPLQCHTLCWTISCCTSQFMDVPMTHMALTHFATWNFWTLRYDKTWILQCFGVNTKLITIFWHFNYISQILHFWPLFNVIYNWNVKILLLILHWPQSIAKFRFCHISKSIFCMWQNVLMPHVWRTYMNV